MALVKYNNNSISAVTSTGLAEGSLVPIKTLTASSSATLSFVHGTDGVVLDSTYPIYVFKLISIHPSAANAYVSFNGTTDGTNYNVTKTSTTFYAYHNELDDTPSLGYSGGYDHAQGTGFQRILFDNNSSDDDAGHCAELMLFNPSSTTFVKHFMCRTAGINTGADGTSNPYAIDANIAGYFNTTSAITGIQFKMDNAGSLASGKIKLYGIKDS